MTVTHYTTYHGCCFKQHHSLCDHPVTRTESPGDFYKAPITVSGAHCYFGIAFTASLDIGIELSLFLGES